MPPATFRISATLAHCLAFALLCLLATTVFAAPKLGALPLSTGCGKPMGRTGLFPLTTSDGKLRTRNFYVQVPADYSPSKPYSLVFVFHGAGGNPAQSESWNLQNARGASGSAIVVFPEGIPHDRDGIGWDDAYYGYDLPFFDSMLKNVEAAACIDTSRVFVAGFSWGGDFVVTLACDRGDVIRAIEANSTDDEFSDKNDYKTYANYPCPAKNHPAVRFEHAEHADPMYPAPLFATTSQLLQHLNGCGSSSSSSPASSGIESCVVYNGCQSRFIECSFDRKIGHTLPPNWAQDTWDFFSGFPSSASPR